MDIGVLLPIGKAVWGSVDPRDVITFGVRAEELGFASLFVNDSLVNPRLEALTTLAALAPVTSRATLGTGALLPFLRRPVQAAASLSTIDLLSGGRLVVAVGAGFPGRLGRPLYELSQVPWARRFQRLDETVELWRQLWRGEGPSCFHGELLHFDELPPVAGGVRPEGPPIWLGGGTPAALARTGRIYDGWLPYPPDPADYAAGLALVDKAVAEAGRPADAVTPALFVTVRIADDVTSGRRALKTFATTFYGMPLEELETIQALVTGDHDQVVAGLRRYLAAGARHLVVRIGAIELEDHRRQLELLASVRAELG